METKRLTRRQLGLAAAVAVPLAAQQAPSPEPVDELARAQANTRRASATLRKYKMPQLLEPSFAFRP